MNTKSVNAGVRITPQQRRKWHKVAQALGVTPNACFGMLLDNMQIEEVTRVQREPVVTLQSEDGKSSGEVFQANAAALARIEATPHPA